MRRATLVPSLRLVLAGCLLQACAGVARPRSIAEPLVEVPRSVGGVHASKDAIEASVRIESRVAIEAEDAIEASAANTAGAVSAMTLGYDASGEVGERDTPGEVARASAFASLPELALDPDVHGTIEGAFDRRFSLGPAELAPFEIPPSFEPGTFTLLVSLALYSGYAADIDNDFIGDDQDGTLVEVDLEGKFGGALGLAYWPTRSIALEVGADRRVLRPTNPKAEGATVDDFFDFDEVSYTEYFLASRFLLPPLESFGEERVRPYLRLKLAYVPKVDSSAVIRFDFPVVPGFDPIPNPDFDFEGSDYWTIGTELGLTYQWTDSLQWNLGVLYERPLEDSEDRVEIEIANFTSELDVTMRPEGFLVVTGLQWGF